MWNSDLSVFDYYGLGAGLQAYLMIATVAGVFVWAAILIGGSMILAEIYQDKRRARLWAMTESERKLAIEQPQPSLLKAWWRAIHAKVCPIIEFVK